MVRPMELWSVHHHPVTSGACSAVGRPSQQTPQSFSFVLVSVIALVEVTSHNPPKSAVRVSFLLSLQVALPQVVSQESFSLPLEGRQSIVQLAGQGREQLVVLVAPLAGQDPAGRSAALLDAVKVVVCWPSAPGVLGSQRAEQALKSLQEPQVQFDNA